MGTIKDKINSIATQNLSKIAGLLKGTVMKYDSINNLADVYVPNSTISNQGGKMIENVYVSSISGVHASALQPGEEVYLSFVNNNINNPKILCRADELYGYQTRKSERHLRKGDLVVSQEEDDREVVPSSSLWLNPEAPNSLKTRHIGDNAATDVDKIMYKQGTFYGRATGLYNPVTSSIVKLSDDGTINIFTETNNGIKINPKDKTIELLSNELCTTCKEWTIKSNNININAVNDVNIKAKKLNIEVGEINNV